VHSVPIPPNIQEILDSLPAAFSSSYSEGSSVSSISRRNGFDTDGSDRAVMSDEGYTSHTDYISEESDAERLRQADFKASNAQQHQAEKEKFKAASQQSTSIVIIPPPLPQPNLKLNPLTNSVLSQMESTSVYLDCAFPAILCESGAIGSTSYPVIKSDSSLPPPLSHSHNLGGALMFSGSVHADSFDDCASLDNALANFDTLPSLWTERNAVDWLAANANAVTTILRGIVSEKSSILCHLMEIEIYKVRRNLFEYADCLSLSFSLPAPHCIHVLCPDTGSEAFSY
jgi:hypothetical protein